MADMNVSANPAISSAANHDLSRQASYQIEAMCLSLQNAAQSKDSSISDSLPYLVQAMAQRIMCLNSAWADAISNEGEAVETLNKTLFGFAGVQA